MQIILKSLEFSNEQDDGSSDSSNNVEEKMTEATTELRRSAEGAEARAFFLLGQILKWAIAFFSLCRYGREESK
jgi:hypothetical protein